MGRPVYAQTEWGKTEFIRKNCFLFFLLALFSDNELKSLAFLRPMEFSIKFYTIRSGWSIIL